MRPNFIPEPQIVNFAENFTLFSKNCQAFKQILEILVWNWWIWAYFHANFRKFWKCDLCLYQFLHGIRGSSLYKEADFEFETHFSGTSPDRPLYRDATFRFFETKSDFFGSQEFCNMYWFLACLWSFVWNIMVYIFRFFKQIEWHLCTKNPLPQWQPFWICHNMWHIWKNVAYALLNSVESLTFSHFVHNGCV